MNVCCDTIDGGGTDNGHLVSTPVVNDPLVMILVVADDDDNDGDGLVLHAILVLFPLTTVSPLNIGPFGDIGFVHWSILPLAVLVTTS